MRKFYREDSETGNALAFENEKPTGYTEIVSPEELIPLIIGKYAQREEDGQYFFEKFRAHQVLTVMSGTNPPEDVIALEFHLKQLTDELIIGSWLTATSINPSLILSGLYDQTMKDYLQTEIDTYITNNY